MEIGPDGLSVEEFVRAWEAKVFDRRVELVDGHVRSTSKGDWHGRMAPHLAVTLPRDGVTFTCSSLPGPRSLFDPDLWVHGTGAVPVATIGRDLHEWNPHDVLLIVEVADEDVEFDLVTKPRLYAAAGYLVLWVVTRDAVYEHTDPGPDGYARVQQYPPGSRIPAAYADTDLAVRDLLTLT